MSWNLSDEILYHNKMGELIRDQDLDKEEIMELWFDKIKQLLRGEK